MRPSEQADMMQAVFLDRVHEVKPLQWVGCEGQPKKRQWGDDEVQGCCAKCFARWLATASLDTSMTCVSVPDLEDRPFYKVVLVPKERNSTAV